MYIVTYMCIYIYIYIYTYPCASSSLFWTPQVMVPRQTSVTASFEEPGSDVIVIVNGIVGFSVVSIGDVSITVMD